TLDSRRRRYRRAERRNRASSSRARSRGKTDRDGGLSAHRSRHLRIRDQGRWNAHVDTQPGWLFRDDAGFHPHRPCRQELRYEPDLPLQPRLEIELVECLKLSVSVFTAEL